MFSKGGDIGYWTNNVKTISPEETVRKAAKIMEDAKISSLMIVDIERPKGIITERDMTRVIAEGMNPDSTTVGDIMSRDPVTVRISEEPSTVTKIMIAHGFRHMPVVDDNENLVGIISLRDLIRIMVIESVK